MTEAKHYYWLKLRKDFFQQTQIRVLEGMPNGREYAYFLLKLMAESIATEGNLRLTDEIAYSDEMLSSLTNTNVDIVRAAMQAFQALGLVALRDDGTIVIPEVAKITGSESEWAEKKRIFREQRKNLGQSEDNVLAMSSDDEDNVLALSGQTEDIKGQCPIRDKSKEIRDKSKDIKKDKRKKDREAIIAYLNEKLGTSYKPEGKAVERVINGRLEEGYSVEDFEKVIDNMISEWGNDERMAPYLRPSTLFSATHFPEYLNRHPKKKVGKSYFADDDDLIF